MYVGNKNLNTKRDDYVVAEDVDGDEDEYRLLNLFSLARSRHKERLSSAPSWVSSSGASLLFSDQLSALPTSDNRREDFHKLPSPNASSF
jgi:hypothetical protein